MVVVYRAPDSLEGHDGKLIFHEPPSAGITEVHAQSSLLHALNGAGNPTGFSALDPIRHGSFIAHLLLFNAKLIPNLAQATT
jgi:hypothetical protein